MRDPTDLHQFDADTEAQVAKDEAAAQQDAEDIKWLMASKQGRRVAWRLLARTKVFHNPFAAVDPQTNFSCGEMNVGQWFLAEVMEHSPDAFLQMFKERKKP